MITSGRRKSIVQNASKTSSMGKLGESFGGNHGPSKSSHIPCFLTKNHSKFMPIESSQGRVLSNSDKSYNEESSDDTIISNIKEVNYNPNEPPQEGEEP
jgi:hypothetical protein